MENTIFIITLLMALSYICERITNLLKLYLPEKWISSTRSIDKSREKEREKRILLLALISGVLTSTSFFISLSKSELALLFPFDFGNDWHVVILIILSGILLSFGSKFWHDILDIVLSIKNTKQLQIEEKKSQSNTNRIEKCLDKFKKLSHEEQRKVIHQLIKEKSGTLKSQYPEIQAFSVFKKNIYGIEQDYYCLQIDITEKKEMMDESRKIPPYIVFSTVENIEYCIPTDVVGVGLTRSSGGVFIGEGEEPKKLGLSCSRKSNSDKHNTTGTIGLKVYKEGVPYLMSCYHVLCSPELNSGIMDFNLSKETNTEVVSPGEEDGTGIKLGEVTEGVLNNRLDVALAKLTHDNVLKNTYYDDHGSPAGRIEINSSNKQNNINLRLFGRTSGYSRSTLVDYYVDEAYIDYKIKGVYAPVKINGLIKINKFSHGGDSGATIINDAGQLVGMLIGGNDRYSFAIPINSLFISLNLDNNI